MFAVSAAQRLRRGGEAPADTTIFNDSDRRSQPVGTTVRGGVHRLVCVFEVWVPD
jgi:hypothetical protein